MGEMPVLPIFIFDPLILGRLENASDARVEFIFKKLQEINESLQEKQKASIQIFFDEPLKVFEKLLKEYEIQSVYTNEDYEPYALLRDGKVQAFLESKGKSLKRFKDQVIFGPDEVLKSDSTPYLVFTPFSKSWKKKLKSKDLDPHRSEDHLDHVYKQKPTSLQSLKDLSFHKSNISFPGKSLYKSRLKEYGETRNFPALEHGTSRIGLHLRFGTVSVRHCVQVARENSKDWLNELIWREFFMMILFHFPHSENEVFKSTYSKIPWREDQEDFRRWCEGKTGYPLVDAGMRELVQTGYMHNRVRMLVASFLCKHLLISWKWGERFFAKHLLDFELASNVGNWQWAAGTGVDAAPYFRIFNPSTQFKKFDPDEEYVTQWVPEWKSEKYVEPMVDHEFARRRALKAYKENMESKK